MIHSLKAIKTAMDTNRQKAMRSPFPRRKGGRGDRAMAVGHAKDIAEEKDEAAVGWWVVSPLTSCLLLGDRACGWADRHAQAEGRKDGGNPRFTHPSHRESPPSTAGAPVPKSPPVPTRGRSARRHLRPCATRGFPHRSNIRRPPGYEWRGYSH